MALSGLLIVLIIGYQLSVKKTLRLNTENAKLEELNFIGQDELLYEINLKTKEKKRIDSLMNQLKSGSSIADFSGHIFNGASKSRVDVAEISELNALRGYAVKLNGRYINLVKFVRYVEQTMLAFQLRSATFYTETDRRTKEEFLYLELTLEKVAEDE